VIGERMKPPEAVSGPSGDLGGGRLRPPGSRPGPPTGVDAHHLYAMARSSAILSRDDQDTLPDEYLGSVAKRRSILPHHPACRYTARPGDGR
jgi:hypothetical protein